MLGIFIGIQLIAEGVAIGWMAWQPAQGEPRERRRRPRREPLPIDLALQGGGSHGAFTWGVLDRLLEEPWLEVEAISGTSAGAMNAAVFAHGMATGGREAARAALEDFWRRVSRAARVQPVPAQRRSTG